MQNTVPRSTRAIFRLDDSADPGLAEVELLRPKGRIRGKQLWEIKITKIIKPSFANGRVGQKITVVETLLTQIE